MKIGFFTFFFPRITETFILNKITKLIDTGIDIRIIAIADPSEYKAIEDRELEKLVHPDVVKYKLLDRVIYIPLVSGRPDIKLINETIHNLDLDLVHFQWSGLADWVLSETDFDLPIITNFHEFVIPKNWPRQVSTFQTIYNKSDLILPVSDYIHKFIVNSGCPPEKVITHHVGIEIEKFIPNHSFKNTPVNFLTVAGLIEKKGYEDSIVVIKNLSNMGLEVVYNIVGDGILREKLELLVSDLGLNDRVNFLGKMTQDQVIEQYRNCDIFIHPSVTAPDGSHEGIPTSIMEASACELPIISTFHTGIPELVENNISGYLSQEHDVKDLTEKAKLLVESKDLRIKMGMEGRKIVNEKFNVDVLTKEVIVLYSKLINSNLS